MWEFFDRNIYLGRRVQARRLNHDRPVCAGLLRFRTCYHTRDIPDRQNDARCSDAQLAATLAARKRAEDNLAAAVGGLIWTAMAGSAGPSTVPIRSGSWSNNIWTIPVRQ
jgi:hypothetical protein